MFYLVTVHDGYTKDKLFDDKLVAETYYKQFNNAYINEVEYFTYDNEVYYYNLRKNGIVCILNASFNYVTFFHSDNELCIDYKQLLEALDTYKINMAKSRLS